MLLSRSNYKDFSTIILWTENSTSGPVSYIYRGTQDIGTTANWPIITREYNPSINGDWPPPRICLNNIFVGFVILHWICTEYSQNWSYDFNSAENIRSTKILYSSPFLLQDPDKKAYLEIYRGYYIFLGTQLARTNNWILAKVFGKKDSRNIYTGLAALLDYSTGNYRVYGSRCWAPQAPQYSIIQYADNNYRIVSETEGSVFLTKKSEVFINLEKKPENFLKLFGRFFYQPAIPVILVYD